MDISIKSGIKISKIESIPNSVDINRFSPRKKKDNLDLNINVDLISNIPTLIFVGFFSKEKRPDLAYEIWKKSFLQGYKSNLIFVGHTKGTNIEIENEIYKKIKFDIEKNHYNKYINFVETTFNIEQYYNISDIFIFISNQTYEKSFLKIFRTS